MCTAAQVSRASYYRFVGSVAKDQDMELRNEIQKIAVSRPSYGYRRVQAELKRRGQFAPSRPLEAHDAQLFEIAIEFLNNLLRVGSELALCFIHLSDQFSSDPLSAMK